MVIKIETNPNYVCSGCMIELPEDVIFEIVTQCIVGEHPKNAGRLALTNKYFYEQILGSNCTGKAFRVYLDLKQLCPKLTILDAKALGQAVDDEPSFSHLKVLMAYQDLIPHVQNGAGVTLLTMSKGLGIKQLLSAVENKRIGVFIDCPLISPEDLAGNAAEKTYRILISDNVITGTDDKCYSDQCVDLLKIGCEVPTMKESLALYIFKKITDPEYKFRESMIYVRTATPSPKGHLNLLTMLAFKGESLTIGSKNLGPDCNTAVCARRIF
jgi:hypothetical protein